MQKLKLKKRTFKLELKTQIRLDEHACMCVNLCMSMYVKSADVQECDYTLELFHFHSLSHKRVFSHLLFLFQCVCVCSGVLKQLQERE